MRASTIARRAAISFRKLGRQGFLQWAEGTTLMTHPVWILTDNYSETLQGDETVALAGSFKVFMSAWDLPHVPLVTDNILIGDSVSSATTHEIKRVDTQFLNADRLFFVLSVAGNPIT